MNSIQFYVAGLKSRSQFAMAKEIDEKTYFKFVQDLCFVAISNKSNFSLLIAVKNLMHKNFIS